MLWYEQPLTRCYFCRECQHHWDVSSDGVHPSEVRIARTRSLHERGGGVREVPVTPGLRAADRERAEMLGVESYIDDLHGECEKQTQRIAELEQQLDDLRATVQELLGTAS
jgi:hypothetical protein